MCCMHQVESWRFEKALTPASKRQILTFRSTLRASTGGTVKRDGEHLASANMSWLGARHLSE